MISKTQLTAFCGGKFTVLIYYLVLLGVACLYRTLAITLTTLPTTRLNGAQISLSRLSSSIISTAMSRAVPGSTTCGSLRRRKAFLLY